MQTREEYLAYLARWRAAHPGYFARWRAENHRRVLMYGLVRVNRRVDAQIEEVQHAYPS